MNPKFKMKTREIHGMHKTTEYYIWANIKSRCGNPKNDRYKNYGGRGITICQDWKNSFLAFYRDMGPRPSKNHSIDRINNNKNYEKNNCRWATYKQQNMNTSRNKKYLVEGILLSPEQISKKYKISENTIRQRIFHKKSGADLIAKSLHKNCGVREGYLEKRRGKNGRFEKKY